MDGLPVQYAEVAMPVRSRTLRTAIDCRGVGLHSGRCATLTLRPAEAGTGIVFRRTDLGIDIPARHDYVTDTRLCTRLSLPGHPEASVGTVEHLMAALVAAGVDTVIAEIDGPELPILDGSAAPFLFLIDCAGTVDLAARRPMIEVLKRVTVEEGGASAVLEPLPPGGSWRGLDISLGIDFAAAAIGRQACSFRLTEGAFRSRIASARTFALSEEIEQLRALGLARGGSLDNAVVVDGDRVLNPAGLRMSDEFVRHKVVDAVGDLAMAGAALLGRFHGTRSGHRINNLILRALFADPSAYRLLPGDAIDETIGLAAMAA